MVIAAFAVAITMGLLLVFLTARGIRERRSASDRRLSEIGGDSGVGLVPAQLQEEEQVGTRGRFDNWFEVAVERSGFDATPTGALAVMFLLAVVLGSVLFIWKGTFGLAALGVFLGLGVPLAVIALSYRRYRWKLQDQIPEAYRMLAGSVRAGQSLEQSLEYYAQRGNKPLSEEFAHTAALLRLGMGPTAALQQTADRVRLLDFDLLVSTMGLYSQTGGNLVLLLERLADSVRDRNQFQGQFFAATAQSRIVAIALGAAAPVMLLLYALLDPEHVQEFLTNPTGWGILAVCGVLEIIGVFWLWRILKVDY